MHAHSWMTKSKPSKGRDNSVHFGDVGEVVIESRNDVKSSRPEVFSNLPTGANPTINN